MPWRETDDPYRILISEIMLQQTQVERVRTKYIEFLKKFPNTETLARASLGDVLRVWSGLGYNRRAKFLHECAKIVAKDHGGKFPDTFTELDALPGIGMSTAGALLAFSFGESTPMIDTNIRRILVRVFFTKKMSRQNFDKFPSDKVLYDFASALIPAGKGRAWNYAMLDLGASLCSARSHSVDCPLLELHGKVDDFVYKKPQKKFAGSRRYYRGQVLKHLSHEVNTTSQALSKRLKLNKGEIAAILDDLLKEKLVLRRGAKVSLPS